MGTVVTAPDTPMRRYLDEAGADQTLATYDNATQVLTAPDVSDAALASAKATVDGRTATATPNDKRRRAGEAKQAAIQRHQDAFLLADATYQTALTDIGAATTLADLDAVVI